MAQCQVDAAMFQETQNWHEDGAAAEVGWRLFQVEKEGKAAIAVRKKHMNLAEVQYGHPLYWKASCICHCTGLTLGV